jgi:hypothetical protein
MGWFFALDQKRAPPILGAHLPSLRFPYCTKKGWRGSIIHVLDRDTGRTLTRKSVVGLSRRITMVRGRLENGGRGTDGALAGHILPLRQMAIPSQKPMTKVMAYPTSPR